MDQFGTDALLCPLGGRRASASSAALSFSVHRAMNIWCNQPFLDGSLLPSTQLFNSASSHTGMGITTCPIGTSHIPWISSTLLVHGPFWVEEVFFVHGWEHSIIGLKIMWVSLSAPNGFKPLIHSKWKGKHPLLFFTESRGKEKKEQGRH